MRTIRFVAIAIAGVFVASTGNAFTLQGNVKTPAGCPVEAAFVEVFDVNQLPGGIFKTKLLGAAYANAAGHFVLGFPWVTVVGPPTPPNYESGGPDIVVRVTQKVDGTATTLLDEAPSAARWNLAAGTTLSLSVSALCHPSSTLQPPGHDFVFTRVGRIPVAEIDCRGDIASSGYAHQSATTAVNGDYTNQPFGGTIDLFGFFERESEVNRYKLQYSTDGGLTFSDYSAPLWDYHYEGATHTWVSESMGPATVKGVNNLYKMPYVEKAGAWAWFNRLAVLDTRKLADGNVRFRVRGYNWNESTNTLTPDPAALHIDTAYGAIRLLVDNTPPSYRINDVLLNGTSILACAFIHLGMTDVLEVRFTAHDAQGHLGQYALNALYGHSQVVSPTPAPPQSPDKAVDGYSNHVSAALTWTNPPEYRVQYKGYSTAAMPKCAYQLRLVLSKRTTDGYDLIYHDLEDNWHLAIER